MSMNQAQRAILGNTKVAALLSKTAPGASNAVAFSRSLKKSPICRRTRQTALRLRSLRRPRRTIIGTLQENFYPSAEAGQLHSQCCWVPSPLRSSEPASRNRWTALAMMRMRANLATQWTADLESLYQSFTDAPHRPG
jgi:hypothetical protein